jgi:hypothetical protein
MKSIRLMMLSAMVLAAATLTFAAGQPKVRKVEPLDLSGATRAVQQGKGGGMTRNQPLIRANAYRLQTSAEQSRTVNDESGTSAHQKWGDSVFRK